jgi:peptidyl-dipeptidase Dcp
MAGAHTNPFIQSLDEEFSAELAELGNDIWLNEALFQRVNSVYEQRDALALDSESHRLLTLTWQRFVHAGATLAPAQKAVLRTLNTEAATLQSQFQQRLLGAAKSGGLVVDYRHQLDGLADEEIAAAADAAREKGLSDRWLLTLTNTTQQPPLLSLRDRQTRENLLPPAGRAISRAMSMIHVAWCCDWRRSARSRRSCWARPITPAGR